MGEKQPAEERADYRFFRFLAVATSRLSVAGLVFIVWQLLWYESLRGLMSGAPSPTLIFLLTTTMLSLILSLMTAMVSYMLFKRRGGKVEKTPAPVLTRPPKTV